MNFSKPKTTLSRVVAFLLALTACSAAILVYNEYVYMLGFPDGYITELGRAEKTLAYVFIYLSAAFGAVCVFLGVGAARRKIGAKLTALVILYALGLFCLLLVERHFQATLMDGTGG